MNSAMQYKGGSLKYLPSDWRARWLRKGIPVVLAGFLLFSYALVFVWSRIKMTNLRYEFTILQNDEIRVLNEERKLTIEWATLTSLSHIERIAKEKLAMSMPSKERVTIFYETP